MDEQQLNMLDALADEKYSSALVIKQLVQEVRLQRAQNGDLQQQNAQLQARLNERRMIPAGDVQGDYIAGDKHVGAHIDNVSPGAIGAQTTKD